MRICYDFFEYSKTLIAVLWKLGSAEIVHFYPYGLICCGLKSQNDIAVKVTRWSHDMWHHAHRNFTAL